MILNGDVDQKKEAPKILLLEDYPDLLGFYSSRLREAGFDLRVESDEDHGLAVALREKPDLIILDISLPKAEDFWFIKETKKHPEIADVPVVILTDLAAPEDIAAGKKAGASAYLIRDNFTFAQVIAKIKEVIEKHRSIGA
ncbi:MAG TPA: response regulator [Candidatus Nanoarchaeia archaeon]|nr:response regulator [Candidatus Nanoarchaeia archaeon]